VDPELRVVTVAELGILRAVDTDGDRAVVTITPTYAGCPAMDVIRADLAAVLHGAGWSDVEVVTRLHPAWSSDQITDSGRAKLAAAGIAPPPGAGRPSGIAPPSAGRPSGIAPAAGDGPGGHRRRLPLLAPASAAAIPCPHCASVRTEEVSRFGSTACTSLWRCQACGEPFGHVKAI
jgi:ring-1,2-phenylacetyl-CoA epoxidase subunit PaaD